MNRKEVNSLGKYLVGEFTDKKYELRISGESLERIEGIKKILEEKKGINVVMYSNHSTLGDPLPLGYVYKLIDPEMKRSMLAPISFSHSKFSLKDSTTWFMTKIINFSGVETIRVIQSHQIDKSNEGKATENNMSIFSRLRELKRENKPICFLIFPEGHRSKNGEMIEAKEGLSIIGSILNPVLYIPVGIDFDDPYKRNSLNFNKGLNLTVGEYFLQEKRGDLKETQEILMKRLALCVPIKKRGFYADLVQIPQVRG